MASASEVQRDTDLLQHIARYCDDAIDAARRAGSETAVNANMYLSHNPGK